MNGVRLGGRGFSACRMAPTVSRSSFAGAEVGIDGFASLSGALVADDGPGRSRAEASAGSGLGLSTGVAVVAFAGTSCGEWLSTVTASSSSVRFSALSIADIAAETGSVAGFCFAILSASLHRRRSLEQPTAAPSASAGWPNETPQINHVAVYPPALRMKTSLPAHLANVVNASITMFFHSVQPIRDRA